jgi:hypothetical protein
VDDRADDLMEGVAILLGFIVLRFFVRFESRGRRRW